MPELKVHFQGDLVPSSAASVSIRDRSFRYGEAAFETLRARGLRAFRLRQHLTRLAESSSAFGWVLPWPQGELEQALIDTLSANELPESRVRIHASPGGGDLDRLDGRPVLLIEAQPFVEVQRETRRRGVSLAVWEHRRARRGVLARAKTASYLENLMARRSARQDGAHDAVILNDDEQVCEASCANLFAVHEGLVRTPPLECGVLGGITRRVVLERAATVGARIREASLCLDDLRRADEIFLTSTGVEVLPVIAVDGTTVGAGVPGPVTAEVQRAYRSCLDDELGSAV